VNLVAHFIYILGNIALLIHEGFDRFAADTLFFDVNRVNNSNKKEKLFEKKENKKYE
jgi:hypothetical protein